MVLPIEGQLSLMQVISALEMLQTAQREQAIIAERHEQTTERVKDTYERSVTRDEEAQGKIIRDQDPRRDRERPPTPEKERDEEGEEPTPEIDILV